MVRDGNFDHMWGNVPWQALKTVHARFAMGAGNAVRYPAEITPFAATIDNSADSLLALTALLHIGEKVYVMSDDPPIAPGLATGNPVAVLQMLGPETFRDTRSTGKDDSGISRLTAEDSAAMVALTEIAFPGFFRSETYRLGAYYGIRIGNELVAMAGERLALPGHIELSGVCTRPGFTGRGYAASLIAKVMDGHARAGIRSFLHVKAESHRAIELYKRFGFYVLGEKLLYPLVRQK